MTYCGQKAHEASGKQFIEEEIEALVAEFAEAKQKNPFVGLKQKKKQVIEDTELVKLLKKRVAMQNAVVESRLLEIADEADRMTGNPALGIQAKIVGVNAPLKSGLKSVHSLQVGLMHKYAGGLLHDLRQAKLLTQFNSMEGDMELGVARSLAELNTDRADLSKVDAPNDAKEIAKIMHKYQKAAIDRENRAGAYIRPRQGYVVRQNHAPRQMIKKGEKAWIKFVNERLDWDKMDIPVAERAAFLRDAYAAIKSGIRITSETDDVTQSFKGPSNLARRESASRTLVFKDADKWMEYDKEFGYASVREAYMQDLFRAARATAVMQEFGTNPHAMMERVVGTLRKKHRSDDKKIRQLNGRVSGLTLKAAMDEVTGEVNMGASSTAAQWNSSIRALQTMAKLGGAWVTAWADIPFMSTARMNQGTPFFQAWGEAISAPVRGMNSGERRAFSDLLGAGLEGQLGDFMSRMHAQDEIAGKTSKMLHYFFKLNLLGPWTDANKRGITGAISRDLARNIETPYSQLPSDLRRLLRQYDINSVKWDIAQKAIIEGPDGRQYILPKALDDLDMTADFPRREEVGTVFAGMSDFQKQRLVTDAQEGLIAFLTNEADHAVPSPGARERAILRQGYRPGTPEGEAIRYMMQFKSFGVSALTRVLGRQVYGTGAKTLREQLGRGVGANMGLINVLLTTWFMGAVVLQTKEWLKGREPREITPMFLSEAMLQGGGFGIYGDFLLGESFKYGASPLETVAGPVPSAAADLLSIGWKLRANLAGDENKVASEMVSFARSNTPLQNLFYTKQVLDYMLWYHAMEAANPGYLRRMERRFKKEGQEFFMKPSDTIATGGGFR